jgi:hypothetical protein
MNNSKFDFDIAISFLSQDETYANKIKTFFSELNVFVYSDHQDKIVSKDSDEVFKNIFLYNSKIVVVLYRDGWGKSSNTYIEQEAIKDRIFKNKGTEFLIMVNMTGKETMPPWVSERMIWFDYSRFKIEGLAATINNKYSDLSDTKRIESPRDIAKRKSEEFKFHLKRKAFIESKEGVQSATNEFRNLAELLKKDLEKINNDHINFNYKEEQGNQIIIRGNLLTLSISWNLIFTNTLESADEYASLNIQIMKRNMIIRENWNENSFYNIYRCSYVYDLFYPDFKGWKEKNGNEFVSSQNIVDELLNKLLENIDIIY